MRITLEIKCPTCLSDSIKKNGIKVDGKQNYQCKDCKRQFIGDHALSYLGCHSGITRKILQLMVRGSGIRDIAEVLCPNEARHQLQNREQLIKEKNTCLLLVMSSKRYINNFMKGKHSVAPFCKSRARNYVPCLRET